MTMRTIASISLAVLSFAVTGCSVAAADPNGEPSAVPGETRKEMTAQNVEHPADTSLRTQIAAVYVDTLERTPQEWEIDVWQARIENGTATLASMRHAFAYTAECGNKIISVYTGTLDRTPATWEVDTWRNNLDVNGWGIKSMRHAFTQSEECGIAIVGVYESTLNRLPATWEVDTWRNNLDVNGWTIASMRAAFLRQ